MIKLSKYWVKCLTRNEHFVLKLRACHYLYCVQWVPWGRVIISALLVSDCKWWVNFSAGGTLPVNYTANCVRGRWLGRDASRDGGGEGPGESYEQTVSSQAENDAPLSMHASAWGMISHVTHAWTQNPHLNENLPSRVNKGIISQYKLWAGNKPICCTDSSVFLSSSSSNLTKLKLLLQQA